MQIIQVGTICVIGRHTALIINPCVRRQAKVRIDYKLILERAKILGSRFPKLAVIILVLSLMTGAIFSVRTMSTKKIHNKRLVHYKHPIIVLKVDNRGCQAKMEMRTHVAVAHR